jgi:hypothetical protein
MWANQLLVLRNLEFVAHVVPHPLPDDEAPAVVLDVVGRLDEGDDGALVRVLRFAVDHRQLHRDQFHKKSLET